MSDNYRKAKRFRSRVKEGQVLNTVWSAEIWLTPQKKTYQQAESGAARLGDQESDSTAMERCQQADAH